MAPGGCRFSCGMGIRFWDQSGANGRLVWVRAYHTWMRDETMTSLVVNAGVLGLFPMCRIISLRDLCAFDLQHVCLFVFGCVFMCVCEG